jgi:hypothetical protein
MNKGTVANRGPRRAAALAVAATAAVLTAGCGGGAAPPAAGPPTHAQEIALAQCMRAHGVPSFPDPRSSGGYSLTPSGSVVGAGGSVNINSSQAQAAYGHCRHLLPGGPSISQLKQKVQEAQQQQEKMLPVLVKFSQCMRGHGVPDFPDPAQASQSPPATGQGQAINPKSPQFLAAYRACQHVLPAGAHLNIQAHTSRSTARS